MVAGSNPAVPFFTSAATLGDLGRYEEALEMFRDVYEKCKKVLKLAFIGMLRR